MFVRYWPQHIFQQEWVYNAADIDGGPRRLGSRPRPDRRIEKLRDYYPDRTVWLLEPDASAAEAYGPRLRRQCGVSLLVTPM